MVFFQYIVESFPSLRTASDVEQIAEESGRSPPLRESEHAFSLFLRKTLLPSQPGRPVRAHESLGVSYTLQVQGSLLMDYPILDYFPNPIALIRLRSNH
jgi:hypothetical protein